MERIQLLPSKISGSSTNIASAIDLALQVLAHPSLQGYQKRIWILSDGLPNAGQDRHAALLKNARESWVNLNTVALGNFFNSNHGLLRDMATATHNGKFYEVKNLRELRAALGITRNPSRTQRSHRAEATVYAIDCSGSMLGAMEGKRKIDVAVQALEDLIAYKQQTWS
ncbi:MAG: hypothetical protein A2511_12430 [Deltaproteobacteria bacterium RIFOXYD12_FULL_50_9]|nr:MAG: hypothetical protein A2511_12430 [Deltaproteobacteria bacterium RIFOXYD12_FULL_50_9]